MQTFRTAKVISTLHDCRPNPLNPQHNRQADSQLYPILLPCLCLISRNHLPPSLLLVHSQGPFPASTRQPHTTSELRSLQHDGCGTSFDTIIAVNFQIRPTRTLPSLHLHFYTSAIFNPLGILKGQLVEG